MHSACLYPGAAVQALAPDGHGPSSVPKPPGLPFQGSFVPVPAGRQLGADLHGHRLIPSPLSVPSDAPVNICGTTLWSRGAGGSQHLGFVLLAVLVKLSLGLQEPGTCEKLCFSPQIPWVVFFFS